MDAQIIEACHGRYRPEPPSRICKEIWFTVGQEVQLAGYSVVNGYVPVFADVDEHPIIWVKWKRLLFMTHADGGRWAVLDDDTWFGRSWWVNLESCEIRVKESDQVFASEDPRGLLEYIMESHVCHTMPSMANLTTASDYHIDFRRAPKIRLCFANKD